MFRLLTIYLKPVMPALALQVEQFLNIPPLAWGDAQSLLPDGTLWHPSKRALKEVYFFFGGSEVRS
jgi:methionyl-tRNA synthetase